MLIKKYANIPDRISFYLLVILWFYKNSDLCKTPGGNNKFTQKMCEIFDFNYLYNFTNLVNLCLLSSNNWNPSQ